MPERKSTGRRFSNVRVIPFGDEPELKTASHMHVEALKDFESNQISDPFAADSQQFRGWKALVQMPYNPGALLALPNRNSVLRQCVEAMVTNISKPGHTFSYIGPEGQQASPAAEAEFRRIKELFDYPNGEYSLTELRARVRYDLEATGNAYIEVARNQKGEVASLWHVPAQTVRMTKKMDDPVPSETLLFRDGRYVRQTVRRRFRLFVQRAGTKWIYFKEFGDSRVINYLTGEEGETGVENSATELIHLKLYDASSPYGIPRWVNNTPAILGSREAELTNMHYFKDNAVPAMAVCVAGGQITEESFRDIVRSFTEIRGRQAHTNVVFVEAAADDNMASEEGHAAVPRLEIKPLGKDRQTDGQFLEYIDRAEMQIRSSFRLPPIIVGRSNEYSHATAKISFTVAESQVFGPEREMEDEIFNQKILPTLGAQYWRFEGRAPKIVSMEDLTEAIERLDKMGGMTPNIAIGFLNSLFDLEIPLVLKAWGDYPYSMILELLRQGKLAGIEELERELPEPPEPPEGGEEDPENRAKTMAVKSIHEIRNLLRAGAA